MSRLRSIQGMKYPDEYVTRFFFKEGLDRKRGRVLELGCGSGNNLMLFHEFGWDVMGLDIDSAGVRQARANLKKVGAGPNRRCRIERLDIEEGLPETGPRFNVVLLPNILNYIRRESLVRCLRAVRKRLAPGGYFFMRLRLVGDYRYGKGKRVEKNGFILKTAETGEKGLLNVFYSRSEVLRIARRFFNPKPGSLRVLGVTFDNWQKGKLVGGNRDLILWGRTRNA